MEQTADIWSTHNSISTDFNLQLEAENPTAKMLNWL